MDPFHLGGDQDVASSSVLRTGIQTLAALGGGDLLLFQVTWGGSGPRILQRLDKHPQS